MGGSGAFCASDRCDAVGLLLGGLVPDFPGVWVDSGGHAHRDDAVLWSGSDFRCGERVFPRFGEHCGHATDGGYLVLTGAVLLDHGA